MIRKRLLGVALSAAVLLGGGVEGIAREQTTPPANGADSFTAMLARLEAAQVDLVRGRPDPFKAMWSHGADVTLTGGLGGAIEKGWARVSQRLDWVSSQYADGTRTHEEVSRGVGKDLAYVVLRETIRFRVPGQSAHVTQELRVTMVFRQESGEWRIAHRHADAQVAPQPSK